MGRARAQGGFSHVDSFDSHATVTSATGVGVPPVPTVSTTPQFTGLALQFQLQLARSMVESDLESSTFARALASLGRVYQTIL